jgi:hypothetical protein
MAASDPMTPMVTAAQEPDRVDAEVEAIRSHVWVVDDRLLVFQELPAQSVASMNLMFERLEELAAAWPRFAYVVDLSEAGRPGAEVRAELRRRVARLRDRLVWVGIVVGDNVVMRAMARLVAYAMGLGPVSLHSTRDEAIAKVRDVLAERESSN